MCKTCSAISKGKTLSSRSKKRSKEKSQPTMFKEIWEERKHVSWLSGAPIDEYNIMCFAHVLPKGRFTHWRTNKDNIILLTPWEHVLLDQGTEKQREKYAAETGCDWNKIYELRKSYEIIYNNTYDVGGTGTILP